MYGTQRLFTCGSPIGSEDIRVGTTLYKQQPRKRSVSPMRHPLRNRSFPWTMTPNARTLKQTSNLYPTFTAPLPRHAAAVALQGAGKNPSGFQETRITP